MIKDNSAPKPDNMARLIQPLKLIDATYLEDILGSSSQQIEAISPSMSRASVCSQSSGRTFQKAKHHKLSANLFIDTAAIEDDKQEDMEEELEELIHRPQAIGPSRKLLFQQRIDTIINRLNRRAPEQTAFINWPEMSQLLEGIVLPYEKLIFVVDFFSGTFYKFIFMVLFSYIMYS